jgi:hypothetical protein
VSEALTKLVGPVLEAGRSQLGRADTLRAELLPVGLVVAVFLLGHLPTLFVEAAGLHIVVAEDVVAAEGFLLQQRRGGHELQPGGRGQFDDLGGAPCSVFGQYVGRGPHDLPSDVF